MESFLQAKRFLEDQFEPFFSEDIASQLEVPEVDVTLTYSFEDGPTLEIVVPKEIINAYYRNSEVTPFKDITVEGYERDNLEFNGEIIQCTFIKGGNYVFVKSHGCQILARSYKDGFGYDLAFDIGFREHGKKIIAIRALKSSRVPPFDINFIVESYVDGKYILQTESTSTTIDEPKKSQTFDRYHQVVGASLNFLYREKLGSCPHS